MNGFELKYNNQVITASIENGVTSIFIDKIDGGVRLVFRGLDSHIKKHLTWFESRVIENDKITIKVVKANQVAEAIKSEASKMNSLKDKLNEYNGIKNYLEKEGLIIIEE